MAQHNIQVFPLFRLWLFIYVSVMNLAQCLAYIKSWTKYFTCFKPQFPHLYGKDEYIICLIVLLWQTQIVYIKYLTWWLADHKPSINGSSYSHWKSKDPKIILLLKYLALVLYSIFCGLTVTCAFQCILKLIQPVSKVIYNYNWLKNRLKYF